MAFTKNILGGPGLNKFTIKIFKLRYKVLLFYISGNHAILMQLYHLCAATGNKQKVKMAILEHLLWFYYIKQSFLTSSW